MEISQRIFQKLQIIRLNIVLQLVCFASVAMFEPISFPVKKKFFCFCYNSLFPFSNDHLPRLRASFGEENCKKKCRQWIRPLTTWSSWMTLPKIVYSTIWSLDMKRMLSIHTLEAFLLQWTPTKFCRIYFLSSKFTPTLKFTPSLKNHHIFLELQVLISESSSYIFCFQHSLA